MQQARGLGCLCWLLMGRRETEARVRGAADAAAGAGMEVEVFWEGHVSGEWAEYLWQRRAAVSLAWGPTCAAGDMESSVAALRQAGYGDSGPRVAVHFHITPENAADIPARWRWIRGRGWSRVAK